MRKATMKPDTGEDKLEDEISRNQPETEEKVSAAKPEAPLGGALGVILPPVAAKPAPAPEVEGPKVSKFKVTNHNGVSVLLGGGKTQLAYGKIVDDQNYDIDHLTRSGVLLEAL